MPRTRSTVDQASSTPVPGTFAPADTDPHPLVNTPTKCKRVRVMAPTADTPAGKNNKGDVLLGALVGGVAICNDRISPDGSRDTYLHIDDASKIQVRLTNATDKLEYRIET